MFFSFYHGEDLQMLGRCEGKELTAKREAKDRRTALLRTAIVGMGRRPCLLWDCELN